MKVAFRALFLGAPLVLAGCGQHFDVAQSFSRNAVLLRCSAQVVRSVDLRTGHALHAAMGRIEGCMAEERLPGYAVYDPHAHAVRYAYEADVPHVGF